MTVNSANIQCNIYYHASDAIESIWSLEFDLLPNDLLTKDLPPNKPDQPWWDFQPLAMRH